MATSLNGTTPAATYTSLLKLGDNSALSATLKRISDGAGNDTPIEISTAAVQFGGSTGMYWDNTNRRLGIGTNAPSDKLVVQTTTTADGIVIKDATNNLVKVAKWTDSSGFIDLITNNVLYSRIQASQTFINTPVTIGSASAIAARLAVRGSGATSATTALRVENSAGTITFDVKDNGAISSLSTFTTLGGIYAYGLGEFVSTGQSGSFSGSVRVGASGNNNASAILDAVSTTKGFLPPRMTTTQKNAIASPAAGLVVYDTTTNKLCCYDGTIWNDLF